jgi:hypothetical protein
MSELSARKRIPAWVVVPVLLLAIAPFALHTSYLCACAHPLESLLGMRPLGRSDAELAARLRHAFPPGTGRVEAERTVHSATGATGFDQYCRSHPAPAGIECGAVFERDWLGFREHGLTFAVGFDAAGKVGRLDMARFTRNNWN